MITLFYSVYKQNISLLIAGFCAKLLATLCGMASSFSAEDQQIKVLLSDACPYKNYLLEKLLPLEELLIKLRGMEIGPSYRFCSFSSPFSHFSFSKKQTPLGVCFLYHIFLLSACKQRITEAEAGDISLILGGKNDLVSKELFAFGLIYGDDDELVKNDLFHFLTILDLQAAVKACFKRTGLFIKLVKLGICIAESGGRISRNEECEACRGVVSGGSSEPSVVS